MMHEEKAGPPGMQVPAWSEQLGIGLSLMHARPIDAG
jgi:hypothetical protein